MQAGFLLVDLHLDKFVPNDDGDKSSYLKWGELVLAMVGSELAMGRNLHKAGETFRNHVQITCPNFVMLPTLRNVKITVYSQSAFLG